MYLSTTLTYLYTTIASIRNQNLDPSVDETHTMRVLLFEGHALTKSMLTQVCFPKDPKHELLFPKVVFTTEEAADIKRLQPEGNLLATP